MKLTCASIETREPLEKYHWARTLTEKSGKPLFILDTCQRLEIYGQFQPGDLSIPEIRYSTENAMERLTRIAAGLESRVIGELEILGQVRAAYKTFNQQYGRNNIEIDRLFQDILALARKARKESGIDRQLTSLSGLAARMVLEQVSPGDPLAVIGAGSLSSSVLRYFHKRGDSPIRVASRCPEKALQLASRVNGFSSSLHDLKHLLDNVTGVVCATAAPHPILYPEHLPDHPIMIVDLGAPADCSASVKSLPQTTYVSLEEVEERAQINTEDRKKRAQIAADIIRKGAASWATG